jgi:hypothetical protein
MTSCTVPRPPRSHAPTWERNQDAPASGFSIVSDGGAVGHRWLLLFICLLLLLPAPALAANSAQDAEITVSPVVRRFPVTTLNSASSPQTFTITNQGSAALSLGTIALAGTDADQFVLESTDCGASLAAGAGCSVAVSFEPTSQGTKTAWLKIPNGSTATPVLSAFVTNNSSAVVEAQRRMPPVLTAVTIPDTLTAGQTYTLTWSLEGYNDSYESYAALFDCTGIGDGTCGSSYSDATRIAASGDLTPDSVTPGSWQYNGVTTQLFTYTWDFTVPATRADGSAWAAAPGTGIVVRFYQKSDIDAARNNTGISLLIPGSLAVSYYDNTGRRIIKHIVGP